MSSLLNTKLRGVPFCKLFYPHILQMEQSHPYSSSLHTSSSYACMKYLIHETEGQRIQDMAVHDRPRERMMARGAESLSDLELLAILIGSGSKERPVTSIAKALLTVMDKSTTISHDDLLKIPGLGIAKATLVAAALELGRRRLPAKKRQISTPGDIYPLISHYAGRMQEHFLSIALNGAHEVLSVNVCSIGLVNRTLVHPRDHSLQRRVHIRSHRRSMA